MVSAILGTALALVSSFSSISPASAQTSSAVLVVKNQTLAEHFLDLNERIPGYDFGNRIFADNILLNLHYFKGDAENLWLEPKNHKKGIDWEKVREPFEFTFTLQPWEVFAYHDTILPEYKDLPLKTTNTHFEPDEGYESLEGLVGNGVCHLASLMNWTAQDAGLEVVSKVNHDFTPMQGLPKAFGTSVRWSNDGSLNSRNQNLYIKNNLKVPVSFNFKSDGDYILLSITKP